MYHNIRAFLLLRNATKLETTAGFLKMQFMCNQTGLVHRDIRVDIPYELSAHFYLYRYHMKEKYQVTRMP